MGVIVGVTGSRNPRPESVIDDLRRYLVEYGATELHHGDCLGFDKQAHDVATEMGLRTVVHPPNSPTLRAFCEADQTLDPLPYLERNKAIVQVCERLIAAPDGPEKLRSGTWSTVRFAKRVGRKGVVLGANSTQ